MGIGSFSWLLYSSAVFAPVHFGQLRELPVSTGKTVENFSQKKQNKQTNKNIKIPSWDGASIKSWSVQGVQLNSLPLYVQGFHSLLCIRSIAGGGSGELSILALWLKSIQRVFRGWQLISQTLNLNANIYHTAPAENRQWNLALLPWALQDFSRCSALI